jgi:predicted RNase H-like HicB family nuclease
MAKEERVNGSPKTPEEYLKEPYARVLLPDGETGTYAAEILEFPGCIAQGDTPEEAYRNLEEAAKGWIQAALDLDQDIPEPWVNQGYSGRVALRLPRSLHRRAAQLAEREGTSLNQFLVAAVAEKVGASDLYERLTQRLAQRSIQVATQIAIGDIMKRANTAESWELSESIPEMRFLDEVVHTPMGTVSIGFGPRMSLESRSR